MSHSREVKDLPCIRRPQTLKERIIMLKKGENEDQPEDSAAFKRPIKYALFAFAIIELIVFVYVVYKSKW
jgi:hypothetical protein